MTEKTYDNVPPGFRVVPPAPRQRPQYDNIPPGFRVVPQGPAISEEGLPARPADPTQYIDPNARSWEAGPTFLSEAQGAVAQANRGISNLLGIPGDIANWGARQLGYQDGQFVGSDEIAGAARYAGVDVDSRAQTLPGRIAGGVFEGAATALLPMGPATRAAQSANQTVAAIGRAFKDQPGTQVASGAGGAFAANEAAHHGAGPWGQIGASLAGTLAGARAAAGRSPAAQARKDAKRQVVKDFQEQQVPPSAPAVGGPFSQLLAKTLRVTPGGMGTVQKGTQAQVDAVQTARDRAAGQYGQSQDIGTTGRMIQRETERFARARPDSGGLPGEMGPHGVMPPAEILKQSVGKAGFRGKSQALYDRISAQIDPWQTFDPAHTREALEAARFNDPALEEAFKSPKLKRWVDLLYERGTPGAPGQAGTSQSRAVAPTSGPQLLLPDGRPAQTRGTIETFVPKQLSWSDLRNLRTEVGYLLEDPKLTTDVPQARLKAIYGALSRDIEEATRQVSPELLKDLKRADRFYQAGIGRIRGDLQKFFGADSGEQAFQRFMTAATRGAGRNDRQINALKRSMSPEAWSEVSSTVISQLGVPAPSQAALGQDFNVARFFADYERLTPAAKQALFDANGQGVLRENFDQLVRVAERVAGAEQFANPSGTGGIVTGAGFGAMAVHDWQMAALSAVGAHASARLIMNQRFAKFLARPTSRSDAGLMRLRMKDLRRYASEQELRDPALAQAINHYLRELDSRLPNEGR